MTPRELLTQDYSSYGHSRDSQVLRDYFEENCVVAYTKESLGIVMIIRGTRKYFAFVSLKNGFNFGGYDYKLTLIEPIEAIKVMQDSAIIVDKDLYGKLTKTLLMEAL